MSRDDRVTEVMPRSTGNYARMGPRAALLCQALWVLLVVSVLVLDVAGALVRHDELVIPIPEGGDPAIGQYLPAEHEALAELGISISSVVLYLEGLSGAVTLACLAFGALIYWRRRDSLVAFVASLFLILVSIAMTQNVDALARADGHLEPVANLFQSLSSASVLLLLLLFPNGRLTTRWLHWVLLLWVALHAVRLLLPHPPFAEDLWSPATLFLLNLPFYLLGLALQVRRYRSISTPAERQQTKWIVVAFAALVAIHAVIVVTVYALPAALGTPRLLDRPLLDLAHILVLFHLFVAALALTPVAFTFAILRYRLWDIDFIINRSLVYGSLTAGLVAFFAVCVFATRQVMTLFTTGEHLWVALCVAMLAVGVAFQPSRRFLHDWVNRRLYGIGIRPRRPVAVDGLPTRQLPTFEGYRDLRLIGRGGMAEVYRATDPAGSRDVAIKIMDEALAADDPIYVRRFEREVAIVRQLQHDNIVRLYGHGVTPDGTRFMVMEYVDGVDLGRHLSRRERLTLDEALPFLQDLARALDYAHGEGVVHRDLKPSNVLLDASQGGLEAPHRAVLGDFGIAKLAAAESDLTATNLVGTLDYISPEQIQDAADVDGRADVYSVGVLAYQLLTGRRPFEKSSPVALMLAHLQQPPDDPRALVPDLPPPAAEGVLTALAKRPQDRFATVGQMVAALRPA